MIQELSEGTFRHPDFSHIHPFGWMSEKVFAWSFLSVAKRISGYSDQVITAAAVAGPST